MMKTTLGVNVAVPVLALHRSARAWLAAAAVAAATVAQGTVLWSYDSETGRITQVGDMTVPWVFGITSDGALSLVTQGDSKVLDLRTSVLPAEVPVIKTWNINTSSFLHKSAAELPTTTVHFPERINSFGYMSVYCWYSMNTVTWPTNLTSIGDYAFEGAAFTSLELPDTVTSIGRLAFNKCTKLTTVKMPAKLSSCSYGIF